MKAIKSRMERWKEKIFSVVVYIFIVGALIGLPFAVQSLMTGSYNQTIGGSDDGWLGFWGGYLGAIIAILGVYWQSTKQNKLSQKQLDNEKENQFRQARPFFLVSQENIDFDDLILDEENRKIVTGSLDIVDEMSRPGIVDGYNVYLSKSIDPECIPWTQHNYLVVRNVSTKNMYAVKVFVATGDKIDENFMKINESVNLGNLKYADNSVSINKIEANSDVYLLFDSDEYQINQVLVWYITEIRESIKLYFEDKDGKHGLEYQSDVKLIGNQQEMEGDYSANYNLARFKESKKLF